MIYLFTIETVQYEKGPTHGKDIPLQSQYPKILEFCQTQNFNPSQTTNFRLFQTERVCRQQFQI